MEKDINSKKHKQEFKLKKYSVQLRLFLLLVVDIAIIPAACIRILQEQAVSICTLGVRLIPEFQDRTVSIRKYDRFPFRYAPALFAGLVKSNIRIDPVHIVCRYFVMPAVHLGNKTLILIGVSGAV